MASRIATAIYVAMVTLILYDNLNDSNITHEGPASIVIGIICISEVSLGQES